MCAGLHVTRHSIVVKNFFKYSHKMVDAFIDEQAKQGRHYQGCTNSNWCYTYIYVYICLYMFIYVEVCVP